MTRLRSSRLIAQAGTLWNTYFLKQEHSSLANVLVTALKDVKTRATKGTALRAQVRGQVLSLDNFISEIVQTIVLGKDPPLHEKTGFYTFLFLFYTLS